MNSNLGSLNGKEIPIYTGTNTDGLSAVAHGNIVTICGSIYDATFGKSNWNGLFTVDDKYAPKTTFVGMATMFKSGWTEGKPCGFMINSETKSCQYYANFDTSGYNRISFCINYLI